MLKNYLKIALRNLLKHKSYTFINIAGLAVGMACAILILLWVQDELSFDNFHEKKNEICQAYLKGTQKDNVQFQSTTSPAIASILKDEYPEIVETARLGALGQIVLRYNEKILIEANGSAADPSVFNIFTLPFINGDPANAHTEPYSIVLTEAMAEKYFGKEDPLGRFVKINNTFDFKVTAVIKNLPANSYAQFDFLVPFSFLKELGQDIIGENFYPCSYGMRIK